jgi:hypothetical protein
MTHCAHPKTNKYTTWNKTFTNSKPVCMNGINNFQLLAPFLFHREEKPVM